MQDVFVGFEKAAKEDWGWGQYVAPAVGAGALVGAGIAGLYFGNKKGLFGKATQAIKQVAGSSRRSFESAAAQSGKAVGKGAQGSLANSLTEGKRYVEGLQKKISEMMSDPRLAKYNSTSISPASEKALMQNIEKLSSKLRTKANGATPAEAKKILRDYIDGVERVERKEPAMKGFTAAMRQHLKGFI